jgi:hypothetical protein
MWPAARAATKRAICNGCPWIPWSTIECPADILRHEEKLRPRAGGSGPLSESHERLLRLGTKGCNGSRPCAVDSGLSRSLYDASVPGRFETLAF